jgi:small subunit ribosomal protein S9
MADDETPTPEDAAPDAPSEDAAPETEAGAPEQQPGPPRDEPQAEADPARAPVEGDEPPAPSSEGGQDGGGQAGGEPLASEPVAEAPAGPTADGEDEEEPAPRDKPAVPGAHLEVDIVPEGADPLERGGEEYEYPYASEEGEEAEQPAAEAEEEQREELSEPISTAAIDLASGARYRATGKRKTAIARVTLRPGTGAYVVNGRSLEEHFPRETLQRNIRQPLETVGYQERMDVIARLGGGGISAQAGALRHGVSRALLEADPNLRGELKRRGFLTRDSRAKERKKAGLKKARKRPQFSKR